jgi:hypothetical protein
MKVGVETAVLTPRGVVHDYPEVTISPVLRFAEGPAGSSVIAVTVACPRESQPQR